MTPNSQNASPSITVVDVSKQNTANEGNSKANVATPTTKGSAPCCRRRFARSGFPRPTSCACTASWSPRTLGDEVLLKDVVGRVRHGLLLTNGKRWPCGRALRRRRHHRAGPPRPRRARRWHREISSEERSHAPPRSHDPGRARTAQCAGHHREAGRPLRAPQRCYDHKPNPRHATGGDPLRYVPV